MKYVIIIPDGCADEPQESLGGKTPLEAAQTPAMDELAMMGRVGRANHTPAQLPAGSDVANLSLLGFNPLENFTGRAPIEAAAQGIELAADDWVVRCNLVTIEDQIMKSFTAGHIASHEARELLQTAQQELGQNPGIEFVPGVSYRNLLVVRGGSAPFSYDTRTTPPHDLTDKSVSDAFPRGPGSKLLCDWMHASQTWFMAHPTNVARQAAGLLPATQCWLWGLGKKPVLPNFAQLHGVRGAMITAVDLLRGLATLVGWDRIEIPGATGYVDTDFAAKGQGAIEALNDHDLVCVHIEAPDEASHEGSIQKKIESLESIDRDIVRPVLNHLKQIDHWRMLVTPDHPTFIRTKTHSHGDVPFVIAGHGISADSLGQYSETNASHSSLAFPEGFRLMDYFLHLQDTRKESHATSEKNHGQPMSL